MFFWKVFCNERELKLVVTMNLKVFNFTILANEVTTLFDATWANLTHKLTIKCFEFTLIVFGRNVERRFVLYTIFKPPPIAGDTSE